MSNKEAKRACSLLINASRIGEVGGLRTFTEALVRSLGELPGVIIVAPEGIRFNVRARQLTVPHWLASPTRVSKLRPVFWYLYSAFCFPGSPSCRVLSTTHHVLPLRRHQIVIVHDLRPYFYQDNWIQGLYWRVILPRALKNCDALLTVSETSKEHLVSVYGWDPNRIHVVPNVVDTEFFRPAPSLIGGPEPYLLAVGSAWKHKNVAELLQMHEYWSRDYRLKIVAGKGQYLDQLTKMATECGIADRIEFLSLISKEQLLALYQQCAALVFPSVMEGFGLPPLEAMACGRPVIVPDARLFHELYGNAPIYVQLGDKESWKESFAKLKTDLTDRSQEGVLVAKSFSPARMHDALASALKKIWNIDIGRGPTGE